MNNEIYFLHGGQFTARLKDGRAERLNKLYNHYLDAGIVFPSKSDVIEQLLQAAEEKEFKLAATIKPDVTTTVTSESEKPETQEPGAKELLLKNKIETLEAQLTTAKEDLLKANNAAVKFQNEILELKENPNANSKEPDESKYYLLPKDNEFMQPVYDAFNRRITAGKSKSFAGFILNLYNYTAKNNPKAKQDLIIE